MKSARIPTVIGLLSALAYGVASAQETPQTPQLEVETKGRVTNYSIGNDGWGGVIKKVQALRQIPREQDATVVDAISKNMDNLPPAYIYELVRRTCVSDPQKAAYLFALASSRIRYDAMRCKDPSAGAGVQATLFSLQMPECKDALSNMDLTLASLRKVRDAKDAFASKASPWWMCSHGMQAIAAAMQKKTLAVADWLTPESDWPAVRKDIQGQIDYTLEKHSKKN